MVHIRHVGMRVPHRRVFVEMGVRLVGRVKGAVRMPMVFIVDVRMRVGHPLMNMLVLVMFAQM